MVLGDACGTASVPPGLLAPLVPAPAPASASFSGAAPRRPSVSPALASPSVRWLAGPSFAPSPRRRPSPFARERRDGTREPASQREKETESRIWEVGQFLTTQGLLEDGHPVVEPGHSIDTVESPPGNLGSHRQTHVRSPVSWLPGVPARPRCPSPGSGVRPRRVPASPPLASPAPLSPSLPTQCP